MVVILGDGTIVSDDDPRARRRQVKSQWPKFAGAAVLVGVAARMLFMAPAVPWKDGKIPAAQRVAGAHWDYLSRDLFLVREYSRASKIGGAPPSMLGYLTREKTLDARGREVDYGGADGSRFEDMYSDTGDQKFAIGTRCASTLFSLTVYFCGAGAANDHAGLYGDRGADALERFINATRAEAEDGGSYPTFVYRLGLGQYERSEPGLEHVWMIASMPDGTYRWLQSYISHYALQDWMKEAARRGEQSLTFAQLSRKLEDFRALRAASSTAWTRRANDLYAKLFFVDVAKTDANFISHYSSAHAFNDLRWDVACLFPLREDDPYHPGSGDDTRTRPGSRTPFRTPL